MSPEQESFTEQHIEFLESLPDDMPVSGPDGRRHNMTKGDVLIFTKLISLALRNERRQHSCVHGFTPEQVAALQLSANAWKVGTKVVVGAVVTCLLLGSLGVFAIGASFLMQNDGKMTKAAKAAIASPFATPGEY